MATDSAHYACETTVFSNVFNVNLTRVKKNPDLAKATCLKGRWGHPG